MDNWSAEFHTICPKALLLGLFFSDVVAGRLLVRRVGLSWRRYLTVCVQVPSLSDFLLPVSHSESDPSLKEISECVLAAHRINSAASG